MAPPLPSQSPWRWAPAAKPAIPTATPPGKTSPTPSLPPPKPPRRRQTASAFANAVAADDAYELASARLAQKLGHSEEVRNFAVQMIQDHTVAEDELRDALKRTHGVAVSSQMTAAQQRNLDELRDAGDDFDDDYAKQQIAAHEQALSALRDYAENGMDPALSQFAVDAEDMVADHLGLARKLS